MEEAVVCPVCTLFLRPGMTLQSHLELHPKQKVIEALVKLHSNPSKEVVYAPPNTQIVSSQGNPTQQPWIVPNATATSPGGSYSTPAAILPSHPVPSTFPHANGPIIAASGTSHSHFFYQQFVSSSTPPPGYINQGYVIPMFNQPMQNTMMPGYVIHQQQQTFVTSGTTFPKILPLELPPTQEANIIEINEEIPTSIIDRTTPRLSNKESAGDVICNDEDMPVLKSQIEIEETQITTPVEEKNSEVESEMPPKLQIEGSEAVHEKYDAKTNEIEISPNFITLTNHSNEASDIIEDDSDRHYDMDGMNLILVSDFMQPSQQKPEMVDASQIEDFDFSSGDDHTPYKYRRKILMNIGEGETDNRDENISMDSVNIRADENMPPRGELSGQESNASDVASWSRLQYHEGSSRMSTGMSTYDLLARESWEGSDASDLDAPPPYQSRNPLYEEEDEFPVYISGSSIQGISYKCSSCPMTFMCPKERRVHQTYIHGTSASNGNAQEPSQDLTIQPQSSKEKTSGKKCNEIGSQLFKKKVKKLVIKPKPTLNTTLKTESIESPFDHIFNNIMKVEDKNVTNKQTKTEGTNVLLINQRMSTISINNDDNSDISERKVHATLICVLCCAAITDANSLKQHQIEVHDFSIDTKYKCGLCNEEFTSEPLYKEHLTVHPLECLFCGKYFHRAPNMQMHLKRHMGIRPFKCLSCNKQFLTRQKLQEHSYVHTGETPIKCNLCDVTFKRYSNLVQHRNRHHLKQKKKVKDFICTTCGDVFHSKKKLAWHKEIHENKPKSCEHCSEKFIHLSSLTRHIRRTHNQRFVPQKDRDSENVECPICKGIYLRSSLDTHIKNHSGTRNFTCSVCDKDFTTKWNLKLHQWTHAGRAAKPYKCELCNGAFVRETDYTAHMNSHKAIRPYTCNYCGAQFIRKYNCQRHVKEHEKGKTFNCTICSKTFHRSYYLNDHMRIHSGLRPFSCHICGKTSTTKSNHNKHVRIHHAREPVSTEY